MSEKGKKMLDCLTDVKGIEVGHAQDYEGGTGCELFYVRMVLSQVWMFVEVLRVPEKLIY